MIAGLLSAGAGLQSPVQQHVAGRMLLRRALWRAFRLADSQVRIVENRFGKPLVAGNSRIHFSISHCAGAAVVVVSDKPVGVDIERVRRRDPFAGRRMFHPSEFDRVERAPDPDREFFRLWTLKESYVKAIGTGLAYPVRTLVLSAEADGGSQLSRRRAAFSLDENLVGFVIATCRIGDAPQAAPLFEHLDWRELEGWPDGAAESQS